MYEGITNYFTIETIYMWLNLGVIPFWVVLLIFSQSKICNFFVTSIFPFFILTIVYIYLIYFIFKTDYNFTSNFELYLGLDNLKALFNNKEFIIIFWAHFISINLFCGGWIIRDSQKYVIPRSLIFFPLLFTYFIGPVGIFLYWLIRIFFAKKISLYD